MEDFKSDGEESDGLGYLDSRINFQHLPIPIRGAPGHFARTISSAPHWDADAITAWKHGTTHSGTSYAQVLNYNKVDIHLLRQGDQNSPAPRFWVYAIFRIGINPNIRRYTSQEIWGAYATLQYRSAVGDVDLPNDEILFMHPLIITGVHQSYEGHYILEFEKEKFRDVDSIKMRFTLRVLSDDDDKQDAKVEDRWREVHPFLFQKYPSF